MKATATLVLAAALGFGLAYSFSSAPAVAQGFPSSTFGGSGSLNRPSTDATLKSLSASTVTASTSIQTPVINGAGGQARITLPTGDIMTLRGGTSTSNFVDVTGTSSGNAPVISADGSDANVGLILRPKGVSTSVSVVSLGTEFSNFVTVRGANLGTPPVISSAGSDANSDLALTGKGTGGIQILAKVTKYNGVSTAALGVSPTYAYGSLTASTTSGATVATYTPTANGIFEVGGWLHVSAFTSGSVSMQLAYTDCSGLAVNQNMPGWADNSGAVTNVAGTGAIHIASQSICASNAAAIILKTAIGVATADFYGFVRQVN